MAEARGERPGADDCAANLRTAVHTPPKRHGHNDSMGQRLRRSTWQREGGPAGVQGGRKGGPTGHRHSQGNNRLHEGPDIGKLQRPERQMARGPKHDGGAGEPRPPAQEELPGPGVQPDSQDGGTNLHRPLEISGLPQKDQKEICWFCGLRKMARNHTLLHCRAPELAEARETA